jgi:hypothetical protein
MWGGVSDLINLPTLHSVFSTFEMTREVYGRYTDDDNGENIPLFAALCKEGCDQEMPLFDSARPFAIFVGGF